MKAAVFALTKNAADLAFKITASIKADIFIKPEFIKTGDTGELNIYPINNRLKNIVAENFNAYDSLIFIMACGIVVRTIAPLIKSKTSDPAVIVLDEKGEYAISLLSGHIGGANRLAREVAVITGGRAVITTSTDVNGALAFDEAAALNNCIIENIEELKYISTDLINGKKISFYSELVLEGQLPEGTIAVNSLESLEGNGVVLSNRIFDNAAKNIHLLVIRPKNLVLGIGCKKDTSFEIVERSILDFLLKNGYSINCVKALATIALKASEEGILKFSEAYNIPVKIIDRDSIKQVEYKFMSSDFVKNITGVGNVCEASAYIAAGFGRMLAGKTVYKGLTLALAQEEMKFYI